MPEPPSTFRDFGIIPDDLPPPAEKIHCYFSASRIFGQYLATVLVAAVGLGLALVFAFTMPLGMSLLSCSAALAGFGVFIFLATRNDYGRIELQGSTLHAKHLYTGHIMEHSIGDIESLTTIVNVVRRLETVIHEKLLGRVRGIEIRFRNQQTPLRVMRSDPAMTNAREMIEAIVYRMQQIREIDYEVVEFAGKPLLRRIFWKGEQPAVRPRSSANVICGCLILLALMFGTILEYMGLKEGELRALATVPPHEVALGELIQHGPSDNRHVTVVNFRPGGYVAETRNSAWSGVWIALFPAGPPLAASKEIAAVFHSVAIRDETSLRRAVQNGRVTGICSAARESNWGGTLGKELVKSNPGGQLSTAWSIEEVREPPSEAQVKWSLAGGVACFVTVLVLAFLVFWRNAWN